MTLEELARRCEEATGPDRELDCAIAEAIGWSDVWHSQVHGMAEGYAPGAVCEAGVPRFTQSIDAAETIVPEGWSWTIPGNWPWQARIVRPSDGRVAQPLAQSCKSGALCICAAALRARAAIASQQTTEGE